MGLSGVPVFTVLLECGRDSGLGWSREVAGGQQPRERLRALVENSGERRRDLWAPRRGNTLGGALGFFGVAVRGLERAVWERLIALHKSERLVDAPLGELGVEGRLRRRVSGDGGNRRAGFFDGELHGVQGLTRERAGRRAERAAAPEGDDRRCRRGGETGGTEPAGGSSLRWRRETLAGGAHHGRANAGPGQGALGIRRRRKSTQGGRERQQRTEVIELLGRGVAREARVAGQLGQHGVDALSAADAGNRGVHEGGGVVLGCARGGHC